MIIVAPSTRPDRPDSRGTYTWINPDIRLPKLPLDHPLFDVIVEKPQIPINPSPRKPALRADATNDNHSVISACRHVMASALEVVNQTALANSAGWFPALFPGGIRPIMTAIAVTSKWLGRSCRRTSLRCRRAFRISAWSAASSDRPRDRAFAPQQIRSQGMAVRATRHRR